MSKKRSKAPPSKSPSREPASGGRKSEERRQPSSRSSRGPVVSSGALREIIESVVIAFVLAFLFRTFEAEAFVIPTGSMAPTLMGRHKDLLCEECGYPFQVSASDEVQQGTNRLNGQQVSAGTCPMCRHTMDLSNNSGGPERRSYKGDRILVGKFPYQFGGPERFDVAVFHYPGGAKTNFIKRVVGLPDETLRISRGDVFVRRKGEDRWTVARKSPAKVRAMMQPVYDNDYVQKQIVEGIWPPRWSPQLAEDSGIRGNWITSQDYRRFRIDGSAEGEVWLRYQHRVPSSGDWQQLDAGGPQPGDSLRPQLITDFNAYNTEVMQSVAAPAPDKLGLHPVGDLALDCEIEVKSGSGQVLFELVERGLHFQCRIDVADGTATLSLGDEVQIQSADATPVRRPGTYRVVFSNFDDQLLLQVDGREIVFQQATTYDSESFGSTHPTADDLQPVRIGSKGASIEVRHLKVFRDIYYIAQKLRRGEYGRTISDFATFRNRLPGREEVIRLLSDPREFGVFHPAAVPVEFLLQEDQFLVFGDNSAESKDSRLWEAEDFEYYVKRDLLIGKAMVIYWPHSLDRIPGTPIPIRFFPNFWRMSIVR